MIYHDIEEVLSAFIQANEAETGALFDQSDITANAVLCFTLDREQFKGQPIYDQLRLLPLMKTDEVLAMLGKAAQRSRSAMWQRLRVGRLFPPDKRNPALSWYHHAEAATAFTAADPEAPYRVLEQAADEGWTVRELRHEIGAQQDGVTQTLYWLDARRCKVTLAESGRLYLEIEDFEPALYQDGEFFTLQRDTMCRVTLVTGREAADHLQMSSEPIASSTTLVAGPVALFHDDLGPPNTHLPADED